MDRIRTRPLTAFDLGSAAATEIRNLILDGALKPGERLIESELANEFGTSRGPVRDALAELEKAGLVRTESRRGSFVATFTPTDVEEVYTLRAALETLAIRRAMKNLTPEDVTALEQTLRELDSAIEEADSRRIAELDLSFHRQIITLAAHVRLLDAWTGLADQTMVLMVELSTLSPEVQSTVGGHGLILSALASGDVEAAITALDDHLRQACDSIVHAADTDGVFE